VPDNNGVDKIRVAIRILRSNRKSIVGRVLPDGNVEVRAPFSMTTEKINKWLDSCEPKFLPLVRKCLHVNASIRAHPFGYGGEVLFRGEWIPIREAEDDNNGYTARYSGGEVMMKPGLSEADMRFQIADLFSTLAISIFEEKLHRYSDLMGVRYKAWTIGNARKRHGSCDSNRKITFSWLVVMMSEPVIEYIIIHELTHLKHMNHSKAFRDELAIVLPDWKERQKEHGEYTLMLHNGGWIQNTSLK
jgi:predicted metal-dependent hydrolase